MRNFKRPTARGLSALLVFLGLSLAAPQAQAQDDDNKGDEAADEKGDEDEDKDEDGDKWFAVVGGDVYTGTGAQLRGATVLSKNGKIREIGYSLHIPEDAEVLDATGYRVYPGLVATSSFGLFGGSGAVADSVDPYSQSMTLAVASGITTAVNGNEVAKLKRGELEGLSINSRAYTTMSFNTSSPATKRSTREKFKAAAAYLRKYRQWETDVRSNKDLKEPKKTGVDSNTLAVLKGEVRPTFSASDRTDLLEIARLAQEYGFRPIIRGCREGWTVADELGRAGASAIVTPRDRRNKDEAYVRAGGSSIENAAKLHAAGVSVAVISASAGVSLGGIVGRDIMALTTEAGFAVRGGLPGDAALASITIIPARLLGVDHRIGTLEVGKDCDLIVTDGDVLHYKTFVQWAVIDGQMIYDKEAEMFFAHIRPRPEAELAPAEHVAPGEGEDEVIKPDEGEGDGEGDADGDGDGEEGDGDGD